MASLECVRGRLPDGNDRLRERDRYPQSPRAKLRACLTAAAVLGDRGQTTPRAFDCGARRPSPASPSIRRAKASRRVSARRDAAFRRRGRRATAYAVVSANRSPGAPRTASCRRSRSPLSSGGNPFRGRLGRPRLGFETARRLPACPKAQPGSFASPCPPPYGAAQAQPRRNAGRAADHARPASGRSRKRSLASRDRRPGTRTAGGPRRRRRPTPHADDRVRPRLLAGEGDGRVREAGVDVKKKFLCLRFD